MEDLTKRFDGFTAVNRVNLEVKKGELFGLLGPNGAGKTTLIKMLTTLLRPTSGHAGVWGWDVARERDGVRKSIGIVFQEPSVDDKLTARENLDFHARMYGLRRSEREANIDRVLSLVELEDRADVLVENFSAGMQRRLEIARGFIHHPKVLFLDEPTLGLDVQTRHHIWEHIKELTRETTVVLTTHYMDEADYLCDKIAIMDYGEIIALGTSIELRNKFECDTLEDVFLRITGRELREGDADARERMRMRMRAWRMKKR